MATSIRWTLKRTLFLLVSSSNQRAAVVRFYIIEASVREEHLFVKKGMFINHQPKIVGHIEKLSNIEIFKSAIHI